MILKKINNEEEEVLLKALLLKFETFFEYYDAFYNYVNYYRIIYKCLYVDENIYTLIEISDKVGGQASEKEIRKFRINCNDFISKEIKRKNVYIKLRFLL